MIVFVCFACGQKLTVKEEWAGNKCRCPRCGSVAEVPLPVGVVAESVPQPVYDPNDTPAPPTGMSFGAVATVPSPSPTVPASERPTVPGYELLDELGRGGMGVVYKARQSSLKRLVALKMILSGAHAGEQQLGRFRAEAEAVARLQHPNIVQIYEVGEHDGRPFFSLELVDGGGLDKRLGGNPLPFREAAELMETLARAIQHAHQAGVVHRDLKPANVLLTRDGQPKITDFGLAKQTDDAKQLSHTGDIVGTPSYVAPEQAAGKKDIGPAVDIYSLGAMLYEFLTGRPPFRGDTVMDTFMMVMMDEPVAPQRLRPNVPRDLEIICLKCLEKDPAKRYASCLAFADDLRRYLNHEPIHARPISPLERAWRWCRRNPVPASLLLTITLGSAFGLWYLSALSGELVRSTALESAAQQAELLEGVNGYYNERIATPMKNFPGRVQVTENYGKILGDPKATPPVPGNPAIPIPATLTIEVGDHISKKSQSGMQARLYSDDPFKLRKDGGPRDEFEREALVKLRQNPDTPFARFEDMDGKPVVRYAKAQRLTQKCLSCHNDPRAEENKHDWKEGDVRGVLEIIRPLEKDSERTHNGLFKTFQRIVLISLGVLALSSLLLVRNRRRLLQRVLGVGPVLVNWAKRLKSRRSV